METGRGDRKKEEEEEEKGVARGNYMMRCANIS